MSDAAETPATRPLPSEPSAAGAQRATGGEQGDAAQLSEVESNRAELVACTIVSKNYLAYARTLAYSFREHHPDIPFVVLLVDTVDGCFDPAVEPFETILVEDIGIPDLKQMCFQYSVIELNTAVKPFFLEYLITERRYARVLYFDPDILIVQSVRCLFEMLATDSIVLTPHLTEPLPDDGKLPSEMSILLAGTYNLGFLGISDTPTTNHFLTWWKDRLRDGCRMDVAQGFHVDQKWVDLIPGFYPDVKIVRDPTFNVAYWNLPTRKLSIRNGTPYVHENSMHFMHFSGIDPKNPREISKHNTRLSFDDLGEAAELFSQYIDLLVGNGYHEAIRWPYAYGHFDNGIPIPSIARTLYLAYGDASDTARDPFATRDPLSFFAWLMSPVDEADAAGPAISRLWYEVYRSRPDLRQAFPTLVGHNLAGFRHWMDEYGRFEYAIDHRLLQVHPRSFPAAVMGDGADELAIPGTRRLPPGLNVAGFVRSEKGVGQAARAIVRALQDARVPFVTNEYVDTASLNEEASPAELAAAYPYAVNLAVLGMGDVPTFVASRDPGYFEGHRNIAHLAWELADVPSELASNLSGFDELWAATSFIAGALQRATTTPVRVVPYPIVPEPRVSYGHSYHAGVPDDAFVFLFMWDFQSEVERKNPQAIIDAFKRAFLPQERALLILKCSRGDSAPDVLRTLQEQSVGANIRISNRIISRQMLTALMQRADCYVSLHRSEGFGLTMAEAMSLGKPVIATGYSGNMDFMHSENSFPVRSRLVELSRDYGPYRAGSVWADPDVEHAAELMRFVFEHQDAGREVGCIARRDIQAKLTPEHVGTMIADGLALRAGCRPALQGAS